MDARRIALVAAGILVAVVLFVVLRPGGDDDETAANPTTDVTTAVTLTAETETVTEPSPPPPPPAPPKAEVVHISIEGGVPAGGIRSITVKEGRKVTLVVTSDVVDHAHIHGIDKLVDVGPGLPGKITFTAKPAGRYEIELEERGLQIADLKVQP